MHIKCWVQFYIIHTLLTSVYGSQLDSESLSHDGIPWESSIPRDGILLAWSLVGFENIFIHQMPIKCLLCVRNHAGH